MVGAGNNNKSETQWVRINTNKFFNKIESPQFVESLKLPIFNTILKSWSHCRPRRQLNTFAMAVD